MTWDDKAVQTLTEMWPDNSASIIAAHLGCTKNAVIGRAHRMGLPSKKRNHKQATKQPRRGRRRTRKMNQFLRDPFVRALPWGFAARAPKPQPAARQETPLTPVEPLQLPLMQLQANQCHYIHGEPSGGYCGHPVKADAARPYCPYHASLMFRPIEPHRHRSLVRYAEVVA